MIAAWTRTLFCGGMEVTMIQPKTAHIGVSGKGGEGKKGKLQWESLRLQKTTEIM